MHSIARRLQSAGRGGRYSAATMRSIAVAGEKDVYLALIRELVLLFHNSAKSAGDVCLGAILVFLPGWADIAAAQASLQGIDGLWTLMLHSNLAPEEQQRVFDVPPAGVRKVVLSTNIAETSVTIDDVVYVINSGVMKERVFDADRQLGCLETTLNTWANATQRAGRAGRTQEGVVVHLFPSWRMGELRKWPTPEILSKSLEEVVLSILALGLGDPHEVLARAMTPPSEACVEHAVWLLQEMSIFGSREGVTATEALLPLGRWLAPIPLHPMSSKALFYASLFGVLLPVTAAVAFENIRSPFVKPPTGVFLRGGRGKLARGKRSDHYAVASAYLGWRAAEARGSGAAFLEEHGLSRETLDMGDQLVRSLLRMMRDEYEYDGEDAAFSDDISGALGADSIFDDDPRTWIFFKAALCAAFTPFVVKCGPSHFETDSNEEVHGHGSSCNSNYRPWDNPYAAAGAKVDDWLVYSDAMKTGRVSIMESTAVSAPYILLFAKRVSSSPEASGGHQGLGGVEFDGWRGVLAGGEQALRELQAARRDIEVHALSRLEMQSAQRLNPDALDQLEDVLGDRRLTVRGAVGIRERRVGAREACQLFVGNVADEVDDEELRALLRRCGRVDEVSFATDKDTGARRGFAFVTMGSRLDAELSSQQLNGAVLHGKRIRINLEARGGGAFGAKGKGKGAAIFAKRAERRNWVRPPTEMERRATVEAMRAEATRRRERAANPAARPGPSRRTCVAAAWRRPATCKKEEDEAKPVFNPYAVPAEKAVAAKRSAPTKKMGAALYPYAMPVERAVAAKLTPPTKAMGASGCAGASAQRSLAAAAGVGARPGVGVSTAGVKASAVGLSRVAVAPDILDDESLRRWSELLVESAQSRVRKRRAVAAEDFVEASKQKRVEAEVEGRCVEAAAAALQGASTGLEEKIQRLEEAKRRAVEAEDFLEAGQIKKRLEALQDAAAGGGQAASPEELGQRALEVAIAFSARLSNMEDVRDVSEELSAAMPPSITAATGSCSTSYAKAEPREPTVAADGFDSEEDELAEDTTDLGVSEEELATMTNEAVWQRAWEVTWHRADAEGRSGDQQRVAADAQQLWRLSLLMRDSVGQAHAAAAGRKTAEEILRATKAEQEPLEGLRGETHVVGEDAPNGGRGLCALLKQRCLADQPVQFDHLLALCPKGTTVRQLIQAMAKEPQEFRQSWEGIEFCVKPVNSRCVDWLPVQASKVPPGLKAHATLSDEMLAAAKTMFEDRLKLESE